MEGCFELTGYPEWWTPRTPITKTSAGKAKVQPQVQPHAATTTTEDPQIQGLGLTKGEYEKLIKMIRDTKTTPTVNMTGHKIINNEYLVDAFEEIPNFDDEYQRRNVIESNTNEGTNENWDYNTEVNDETQRSGSNNSETTINDEEPDNNSPKSPVTNDRSDNQGQSLRHETESHSHASSRIISRAFHHSQQFEFRHLLSSEHSQSDVQSNSMGTARKVITDKRKFQGQKEITRHLCQTD
ncbi:unnamed protein product [Lactuca virosa]|uniref:Uncharacterized protein n=1 Tax=Lactuca virosa TaxID=75947 RepID=A0AAU9M2X4_9ASTR|nr:unnamed protein product [Lactuca virosa]